MEEERRNPTNGLIYALMTAEVEGHRLSDEESHRKYHRHFDRWS